MSNPYLAAAYAFVWIVFLLYAWNLGRQKARLEEEVEALKKQARELESPQLPAE